MIEYRGYKEVYPLWTASRSTPIIPASNLVLPSMFVPSHGHSPFDQYIPLGYDYVSKYACKRNYSKLKANLYTISETVVFT